MQIPNLREIFDTMFCDKSCERVETAAKTYDKALTSVSEKHDIPFKEVSSIDEAVSDFYLEAQYFGFLQGFGWAVQLLTGNAPDLEAAEQE